MRVINTQDPKQRIAHHSNPGECWLWCDECTRFFQYKSALTVGARQRDACPFPDCCGGGVGFNLLWWDTMRETDDARWPSAESELAHGQRSPQMDEFYATRLAARIDALVQLFVQSPECGDALEGTTPRHLASFLKMMSDLCWDLTDNQACDYFNGDTALGLLADLPVWSQSASVQEAARMILELRAFFSFCARRQLVTSANEWYQTVSDDSLEATFRHTMKHDNRLRRLRAADKRTKSKPSRDSRAAMRPKKSKRRHVRRR